MENPEEILHSLEEFSKLKPKDIPRELEDYLCFVAKTGDPVYQWGTIKSLFREKLINVITDFYESCPSVEIPPCPNVEVFNYESMKAFILEKLDTFAAAPFTVQRICELLTTPRKEYNRIDKYMRALEKNILVVSTTEPGYRRTAENGEGIVNGLESEHVPETNNSNNDINVEEMDDTPVWSRITPETTYQNTETNVNVDLHVAQSNETSHPTFSADTRTTESSCTTNIDSVITCRPSEEQPYVSIEPVASDSCLREENVQESDVTVTITAIPAAVQKRRDSIEPVVSSADENPAEGTSEFVNTKEKENTEAPSLSTNNIEISLQEESPSEAEALPEENITTAVVTSPKREDTLETCEDNSNQSPDPPLNETPLIQIPIISEITSGVSEENVDNIKESSTVNSDVQEKSVIESSVLTERSEIVPEQSSLQVATASTSDVETEKLPQTVICENSSNINKEALVSSTEEISNDASDVVLSNNEAAHDNDESKNVNEEVAQDEELTGCIAKAQSNDEPVGHQEKQPEEVVLKDIQEFASSSDSQQAMDVDISEESCQEPPTSDS